VGSFHINALPFSCKPAAEPATRFYTISLRRDCQLQRLYGTFPPDAGLQPKPKVRLLESQDSDTLVTAWEWTITYQGGIDHEATTNLGRAAVSTWLRNRRGRITLR
jgi:hypothetical protein